MPILVTNEDYNGFVSLRANAGDWVRSQVKFETRFSKGSGVSNTCSYIELGGQQFLQFQQGDWGDEGFLDGDPITIQFTSNGNPFTYNNTVSYISGNALYLVNPFPFASGVVFPTTNLISGILVVSNKTPNAIGFEFNLTPNGGTNMGSVVDGELTRFELQNVDQMVAGTSLPMTQLTAFSGSLIKEITLTFDGQVGDFFRGFQIDFKFFQWGVIKDGYPEPNYYDQADHIAPISNFIVYSDYGNPNGIISKKSENTQANTGGFNENYNGGVSNYQPIGISWFNSLGDPIDKLDYSGVSTFEAIVNAPNQSNTNSRYNLGLLWRPIDGTYYQNKAVQNLGNNLLVLAPETTFIADGSISPVTFQGYEDENGARWDFSNIQFELTGVDELTIRGTISPNPAAGSLFSNVPDGGRLSTLWVSIGNYQLSGSASDRVSLTLFNDDNYDAPILGVQIPNVVDQFLIDHGGNDVTIPNPQTTTEDDVLFRSRFRLNEGTPYEGIRARIFAYNTVTEEEFTLEDIFMSFASVPFIGNQFQPNINYPRGFNLPPSSDRNAIRLYRDPSLDSAGLYGLVLEYGYLSDWRYWLDQDNVSNDFFDPLLNNNGFNKNWQRFSNSGDWIVQLGYYTRLNGVDDFNFQDLGIRPYEDEDVTPSWGLEVLSTNTFPNDFVDNELHEVTATLVWNVGSYSNPWAEMTIEYYEAGNRNLISSVLNHGGVTSNPLQPLAGLSILDMQFPAANIAVLKALVDTNLIDTSKLCLSARIYSKDSPPFEFLITDDKDSDLAFSVRRTTDLINYPQNLCMRVRRKSDNTEMDFGFINNELDTAGILAFTGNTINDFGFVVTWYNQSAPIADDAIQVSMTGQPLIVDHGVINLATNGKPALSFDGVNQFFNFANLPITQSFCESFVFERLAIAGGGITNSLGSDTFANPYTFVWDFGNNMYSGMNDAVNGLHLANSTTIGSFNVLTRRQQANNDVSMYRNSVLMGIANYGLGAATQPLNTIGLLNQLGGKLLNVGNVQEEIFYKKDKSAEQGFIETNTNNYYNNY